MSWFAREVIPHERALRRWLTRRMRTLPDYRVDEIVQEAYARLWATGTARIVNPRGYFFVTAWRVMSEELRRSRVVAIETVADVDVLNIADGHLDPEQDASGREEVEQVQRLLAKLPPKCRQAFELRQFEELSQREIAQRMCVSESTVEKHLAKALRILTQGTTDAHTS